MRRTSTRTVPGAKRSRKRNAPSTPHPSLTDSEAAALVEVARVSFEVPGPPVPCARARISVNKVVGADGKERRITRGHTPAKTAAYKRQVSLYALNAVNRSREWRRDAQAYRLRVTFYRDIARGDWDNLAKGCADSMNGIVYIDDRQVCDASVSVRTDKEKPRTVVEVVMLEVRK
ncbi:RusA family crossover junction endodeoxyribonuclease [Sorangium sp. So ce118]